MFYKVFQRCYIAAIGIMLTGCQSSPLGITNNANSLDNVNLEAKIPAHSMLEISYLCDGSQNRNKHTKDGQLISVFYDSRHVPNNQSQPSTNAHNQRVILRMGDNDYVMQNLAENTYMSQQAMADGNWLIWHAPTASKGKLAISKTADIEQMVDQLSCLATR